MKFLYSEITNIIEWNENKIPVLSVENKMLFSKLINDIYNHVEGIEESSIIFLDERDNNILEDTKLILEPFSLSVNTKEFEKIVNNYLLNEIKDNKEFVDKNLLPIYQFMSNKLLELPIDVELNYNFNQRNLGKLFPYAIYDDSTTIVEKIFNYIEVVNELGLYKSFIFINLKLYLSDSEYHSFIKTIKYKKIKVLLIESFYDSFEGEKSFIIDKDLCEIFPM